MASMSAEVQGTNGQAAAAAGAVVGLGGAATVAAVSACCAGPAIGPLVVGLLGASGAVRLEMLRPYSLLLLMASGAVIALSLWLGARNRPCTTGPRRALTRVSRAIGWLAAAGWLSAAGAVAWAWLASR